MKKLNIPTKNIGKFAGEWVAIEPLSQTIVAAGKTLKEIAPFVSGKTNDKTKITAAAFKVPHKDEGPYILLFFK